MGVGGAKTTVLRSKCGSLISPLLSRSSLSSSPSCPDEMAAARRVRRAAGGVAARGVAAVAVVMMAMAASAGALHFMVKEGTSRCFIEEGASRRCGPGAGG